MKSVGTRDILLFIVIASMNILGYFKNSAIILISFFLMLFSLILLLGFASKTAQVNQTKKNNIIYFSLLIIQLTIIIASFLTTSTDLVLAKVIINIISLIAFLIFIFLMKRTDEVKPYYIDNVTKVAKTMGAGFLIVTNLMLSNGILYWFGYYALINSIPLIIYLVISFSLHLYLCSEMEYTSKKKRIMFMLIFIMCYVISNSYQMYTRYEHGKPLISIFEIIVSQLMNLPLFAYISHVGRKNMKENIIEISEND